MKSMILKLYLIGTACTLLLATSCVAPSYLPSRQMIPVLKEKKDLHVDATISFINPLASLVLRGTNSTVNLSSTYALSQSLGIHITGNTTIDSFDNRKHIGLGIGYYKRIGKTTNFQCFLNATRGKIDSWNLGFFFGESNIKADTYTVSLQPQITMGAQKNFQMSIIPTIKRNSYYNLSEIPNRALINESFHEFRFEPALGFTYLIDNWTLNAEIGTSIYDDDLEGTAAFYNYLSLGLGYCITCNTEDKLVEKIAFH